MCTVNAEYSSLRRSLPQFIREQILLDRDPHGNVSVSRIETDRLFMSMVEEELQRRAAVGTYKGGLTLDHADRSFLQASGSVCPTSWATRDAAACPASLTAPTARRWAGPLASWSARSAPATWPSCGTSPDLSRSGRCGWYTFSVGDECRLGEPR